MHRNIQKAIKRFVNDIENYHDNIMSIDSVYYEFGPNVCRLTVHWEDGAEAIYDLLNTVDGLPEDMCHSARHIINLLGDNSKRRVGTLQI